MIGLKVVVRAILVFGVQVGEISLRVEISVEEGVEIRNIGNRMGSMSRNKISSSTRGRISSNICLNILVYRV